ncbi:MAG: N-acetylglutaminylglutamine amidotransferase [Acidimicrobiia bacterium]|nr:N-acetylglutaminylglutamine amidotransferase [Acidimicrobiia bacterium]
MCGIAGELRFDGRTADIAAVERMADVLRPRGPDGCGSWSQGSTAFAHRRLKIIDLSDASAQPMVDPDLGLTVVFNGCIYNYRALRAELVEAGYRFFSTGDTEVIAKAWHHWGPAALDRLIGMFAFAIWDRSSGRVVLARDRLGIKPLYVADTADGALRFASTLPALLAGGGVNTSIDPVALHHYLTFHSIVPPPRTILAGVRKVPPASLVTIEPDGRRTEQRWWQPSYERDPGRADWSADDWRDAVLDALRVSVRRRLEADVPVGVLLSGGVDSSLVVGLLAQEGQTDLATFSIGFESVGEIEGDEFRYSDIIARTFATDHHQLRIPTVDLVPALTEAIGAMAEPMVSHDVVAFHLLSREVARHVKVVQSGQGADEVFAGYRWYPPMLTASGDGVGAYEAAFFDRTHADMAQLVSPAHLSDDVSAAFVAEHFARPGASTPLDRALRIDTEVMLVDDPVKRVDNMTMAWGLEARVPFLDHELVELAATAPPELQLAHGGKGILKEAARTVIPSEVIDRPKGYFPVPALTHLDGELLTMVREALHSPAAKERALFRSDAVEHLLAHPNEELTPLRGNKLWQIGLLELWLQHHGI